MGLLAAVDHLAAVTIQNTKLPPPPTKPGPQKRRLNVVDTQLAQLANDANHHVYLPHSI